MATKFPGIGRLQYYMDRKLITFQFLSLLVQFCVARPDRSRPPFPRHLSDPLQDISGTSIILLDQGHITSIFIPDQGKVVRYLIDELVAELQSWKTWGIFTSLKENLAPFVETILNDLSPNPNLQHELTKLKAKIVEIQYGIDQTTKLLQG